MRRLHSELQSRIVEVDRIKLIETLEANRGSHVEKYEQAVLGYKEAAMQALKEQYDQATQKLEAAYNRATMRIREINRADLEKGADHIVLMKEVKVALPVPRNFSDAYDVAISMAQWETKSTIKLTYAEFQCFIRDEWDWKADFEEVFSNYTRAKSI